LEVENERAKSLLLKQQIDEMKDKQVDLKSKENKIIEEETKEQHVSKTLKRVC
jgi:hypothetical protein